MIITDKTIQRTILALVLLITGVAAGFATPSYSNVTVTSITESSATLKAKITTSGIKVNYYFEYGTTSDLGSSTSLQSVAATTSSKTVSETIDGLEAGKTYYFRLAMGYSGATVPVYSDIQSFTTSVPEPTITINSPTNLAETSVTLNATYNNHGFISFYQFEYGKTSSYGSKTSSTRQSASTSNHNATADLTGLEDGTTYHYRLAVTVSGSSEIYYSDDETFTTVASGGAPVVTLQAASGITTTSATLNAYINPNGGETEYYFSYAPSDESSFNKTSKKTLDAGNVTKDVYATITGLTPGTTYYYNITATNDYGSKTTSSKSFTTDEEQATGSAPTVTLYDATNITTTTATLRAFVHPHELQTTYYFAYYEDGTDDVIYTSTSTLAASTTGSEVTVNVTGLTPGATYKFYCIAKNSMGSNTLGTARSFTTNEQTAEANLQITGGTYFGATQLDLGKSYTFSVKVKNNASSSWYGAFYLKNGSENVLDWRKTIAAGETVELSKTYTFTSTGTKTLTLYYQTNVSGSGVVVEGGTNPFTISVVVPTTPLTTPSNSSFTATNATTTGFTAKWAAVKDATKYDIQVAQSSQAWTTIAYSAATSATSINVSGLKPGCQYVFRIKARNDYQTSEWSDALKTPVETLHASTTQADLKIVQENGIKDETVTVGEAATYNAYVKNNSSADWTGAFYLKDGTTLVADWQNRTIAGKSAILLEGKYVPSTAGNRPLTLYYQTDCTGDGIVVPQGSYQNPFVVSVATATTVEENMLTLSGAMTCSPADITLGGSGTLYAKVVNNGASTWSGTVYFTDNGNALTSQTISLASGGTQTVYCSSWTPSTAGSHSLKLMCKKSSSTESDYVKDGTDCYNSLTIYVKPTETTMPTKVNFVHVTESVVPKTVTEGTDVYYFFRVTDSNSQPVSGVKATFTGDTGYSCIYYTTAYSDAQGLICLQISTDGSDAIVSRGGTLTLSSPVLSDASGNTIERLNSSNTTISLKVKDGGAFENVKKVSVQMTPSAALEASAANVASASIAFKWPFTFNFAYDDNDNLSTIGYEREYSVEGEVSASLTKCLDVKANGSFGSKKAETLNLNHRGRSFSYQLIEWFKHTALVANPEILLAAQVLEDWYDSKTGYFSSCINSTTNSGFIGWSVGEKVNLLANLPEGTGSILKKTNLPSLSFGTAKINSSADVKYEYAKQTYDVARSLTTYGDSRSLKYTLGGTIGVDLGKWSFSEKQPWWKMADVAKAYNNFVDKMVPKNKTASYTWTLGINEEEMYTTKEKKILDKISCNTSLTSTWTLSDKEDKTSFLSSLCKEFEQADLSLKLSNTSTNKLSSQGNWAAYLQNMSTKSDGYRYSAGSIYPILIGTSIVGEPFRYFNMWTQGFSSALNNFSGGDVDSYSLSKSLKAEQQNSSKAEFGIKVNLLTEITCLKFKVGLALSANADYYPSESYYSFADQRFMPVALRPAENLSSLIGKITESVASQIQNSFTSDESNEITKFWEKRSAKVGTGAVASQPVYMSTEGLRENAGSSGSAGLSKRALRRRPALAAANQTDISLFKFAINDGETSFDANTDFCLVDFYPAGDLIGITDLGDTLFVVSDVAKLTAVNGTDTLSTAPLGTFKLDTYVGKDDLTPFGFSADQPLDLYYLEDGGEYWHYVGPAGTQASIKGLGSYAMATSMRDDVIAPVIAATYNRTTGRIRLNITDNIGILPATLKVYVNGKIQEVAAIDESNFIFEVEWADRLDMLTLFVTINDLAGNEARLFQMYDYDAELGIAQPTVKDDRLTVKAKGRQVSIAGAEPNVDVTVFSVSGEILQRGTTDADGRADLALGNVRAGVYVITLSNGVSRKIIIK